MAQDMFINEGSEIHSSGVKDDKGRDCGSTVIYGVSIEGDETYLTAYVHANRDGKDFCRNGGRMIRCKVTKAYGERAASAARTREVAQAIEAAKTRAAKKWHRYN